MNKRLSTIVGAAALAVAGQAAAQITFYEHDGFRGRAYTVDSESRDFTRAGFNDRASSVVVDRGRWEVCEDARFGGQCVVLRRGSYESLRDTGLNDRVSSVRKIERRSNHEEVPVPAMSQPAYEWRQRPNERLFEAPVTSAYAVTGPAEQRCWVERDQVSNEHRRDVNVPGAIIGGIVGGILGHQVGSGRGNTVATIGGAVGGAALGANVDKIRDRVSGRDVRRCENVASGRPEYWDVTYNFRGVTHRVQTQTDPGRTITVNRDGQPRT